jgi:hypothetical protein
VGILDAPEVLLVEVSHVDEKEMEHIEQRRDSEEWVKVSRVDEDE